MSGWAQEFALLANSHVMLTLLVQGPLFENNCTRQGNVPPKEFLSQDTMKLMQHEVSLQNGVLLVLLAQVSYGSWIWSDSKRNCVSVVPNNSESEQIFTFRMLFGGVFRFAPGYFVMQTNENKNSEVSIWPKLNSLIFGHSLHFLLKGY